MVAKHHRTGDDPRDDDSVEPLNITNMRMLKWFYRSLAPYRLRIMFSVLAMLLSTGAVLWGPIVIKDVIDEVAVPGNLEPLLGLILLYLGVLVVRHAFGAFRTVNMHLLGYKFMYKVRMQCYKHLMCLGMDYFERQRSGDIMSRISNDVSSVETMVVHGTDDIISKGFHIIMAITVLFFLQPKAALVALAPVPVYVVAMWIFSHYIRPVFRRIRKELGEINAKLQERIGGILIIKSFVQEEKEIEFFDESSRAYCEAASKSAWMWGTFRPGLSVFTSVGIAVLLWYCGWQTAIGAMSVGMIYVFHRYMQRFYRPIGALARVQNMINRALASIARIFELFDEAPSISEKKDAIELVDVEGRVDIDHVSFKYQTGETVLKNVNVSAAPGEVVAIVGRSGAGKTSLVNLIPRFYDPFQGCVKIDGHDLKEVKIESLRRHIGIVLQETFLFNTSVRDNISYARPDASEQDIINAAKGAHAHEFIEQLPEGYDTVIGERGVRLSGGEKQRISIARAFLADPQILILDEATSMVDTEAEIIIQQALSELMEGRTVFIIAHRLSTVRNADRIVVVDAGEIVEQDDHHTLMSQDTLYREMVNKQFMIDDMWENDEHENGMPDSEEG